MDEPLFELREMAFEFGIQVIFMDMRWGIQDQNTLDQNTWNACADGIQWCKTGSMGIFFFSLQGDKLGYRPLPKTVDKEDLEKHLIITECPKEVQDLIFEWYSLDDNALEKQYILKNLKSTDDSAYWTAYEKMLPAMCGLTFDKERYGEELRVGRSVTEYEVRAAASDYPVEWIKDTDLCWSHRHFVGEVNNKTYCNVEDDLLAKACLDDLIRWMQDKISGTVTQTYGDLCI